MSEAIAVTSILCTDNSISSAIKELRNSVIPSLSPEDREAAVHELSDVAEAFDEGRTSDDDLSQG